MSLVFFFFNQKTAYELRISDWSSDVCSSDLGRVERWRIAAAAPSRSMITRSRRDTPSFHPATRKPTECYRPLRDLDTVDIAAAMRQLDQQIGRASDRDRVGQYVEISVVGG